MVSSRGICLWLWTSKTDSWYRSRRVTTVSGQTRYFIELSDIVAVRFECEQCHATVSLPLSKWLRAEMLRSCPNCAQPWLALPMGAGVENMVKQCTDQIINAAEALKRWKDQTQSAGVAGCSMLIEINSSLPRHESNSDNSQT